MITFETKYLRYSIDEAGNNVEFTDKSTGINYLKAGFNPCGRVITDREVRDELYPVSAAYDAPYLTVVYPGNLRVRILVEEHENYITFALKSTSNQGFWAVAANLIDVDIDYYVDKPFVATLMAMSLNTHMQEYPGRNNRLLSEAFTHISLPGVKSAVIGAPEPVLNSIMREVLDEIPDGTMPKAAYSGPYACDCPDAERTYTIASAPFTLENCDEYIDKLDKFGITQVHMHQGSMYSQGDFTPNPTAYPNGVSDLRKVIDRFHERGIQCMLHSYTFFVQHTKAQKGNKYLVPKPHKDIGVCARFTLAEDISSEADFIPTVDDTSKVSTIFGYSIPESDLLWIDDEIIRFAGVDANGFTEIQRGVFGTEITEHKAGSEIRQINSYFGYIAPEKGSELFYQIARETAEFYNACDFDGYYLDAIDGVFVLDGHEFAWYHAVDFINEMFKYQIKPPIFNCCYGPQYPGQWYARTRMGAFDAGNRGYRDFTDAHMRFNEKFAERMYLIGEHGWWQLYPTRGDIGWVSRVMYDEDVDYICTKVLATNVCQCWHGSFALYDQIPLLESYSDKIKLYAKLKQENYFDKRIKDIVRKHNSEFELIEVNGEYKFRPQYTDFTKIESFDDGRNTFKVNNRFGEQTPKLRIEPMFTADNYDCEDSKIICDFDENETVKLSDEPIMLGNVNTEEKLGIGVWVYGDGKGEIINLRLCSPNHVAGGNSDHFVKVDFEGWRYFSFYEFQNCTLTNEEWKPQQMDYVSKFTDVDSFYAAYSSKVNFGNLERLYVMVNKPGDYNIRLRPVKALPHHELVLSDPTLDIDGQKITFKTALHSNTFLEYDPADGTAVVYDTKGVVVDRPEVVGTAPVLKSGENTVTLTADCDSPYQKRAAVTVRTFGEAID